MQQRLRILLTSLDRALRARKMSVNVSILVGVLMSLSLHATAGDRAATTGHSQHVSALPHNSCPIAAAAIRELPELEFDSIFRRPIGAFGAQLSDRALALAGRCVRMRGYKVAMQHAPTGGFMFAPLPAQIDDDDEALADDLPMNTVLVLFANDQLIATIPTHAPVQIVGVLQLGAVEEPSWSRVFVARLQLDEKSTRQLGVIIESAKKFGARAETTETISRRSAELRSQKRLAK
jgi:hypothetical protein